jgi:hypothetical protein
MLSIILSTVAYFLASYYIRRYLDDIGIPKGLTRSVMIFSLALIIAYAVALVADYLSP